MKTTARKQVSSAWTAKQTGDGNSALWLGMTIAHSIKHMKTSVPRLTLPLLLGTLLLAPSAMAGGSEGGGNPIEAGFKTRVLNISTQLQDMDDEAKALLKFDPSELEALQTPGRFQPLCADRKTAKKMHEEGKLARVYAATPNIVYLDCRNYDRKYWNKLFESNKSADTVFFLHEALRVLGKEDENDYGLSSSYLDAKRPDDLRKQRAAVRYRKNLMRLAYAGIYDQKCFINIRETKTAHVYYGPETLRHPNGTVEYLTDVSLTIELIVNGAVVFTQDQNSAFGTARDYRKYVAEYNGNRQSEVAPLIEIAESSGCFSDATENASILDPNKAATALSGPAESQISATRVATTARKAISKQSLAADATPSPIIAASIAR